MKTLFVIKLDFTVYFDEAHESIDAALEALNSKYSSIKPMCRIYKTTEDLFSEFCDKYNMDMSDDEYHELFDNTFTFGAEEFKLLLAQRKTMMGDMLILSRRDELAGVSMFGCVEFKENDL